MRCELERFTNLHVIDPLTGCWQWVGATYRGGYGHFRRKINGQWKMFKAHVFAYLTWNGDILPGNVVRHKCDNTSCVNPDHLIAGTTQDNIDDKVERGRHRWGVNPKHNALNNTIVMAIRFHKEQYPDIKGIELARMFHTSPAQISRVLNRRTWEN